MKKGGRKRERSNTVAVIVVMWDYIWVVNPKLIQRIIITAHIAICLSSENNTL